MIKSGISLVVLALFAGSMVIGCGGGISEEEAAKFADEQEAFVTMVSDVQSLHAEAQSNHMMVDASGLSEEEQAAYQATAAKLESDGALLSEVQTEWTTIQTAVADAAAAGDAAQWAEATKNAREFMENSRSELDRIKSDLEAMASMEAEDMTAEAPVEGEEPAATDAEGDDAADDAADAPAEEPADADADADEPADDTEGM